MHRTPAESALPSTSAALGVGDGVGGQVKADDARRGQELFQFMQQKRLAAAHVQEAQALAGREDVQHALHRHQAQAPGMVQTPAA